MEHISNYKNAIIESSSVPIQSGINFIDDELGGYHPGELMTICGTEDCGKSAFIIAQVDKIAVQRKIPTLVGIGTMNISMFIASMFAYHYDIETSNLWGLLEDPKYQELVKEFMSTLYDTPLYVIQDDEFTEDWKKEFSDYITENKIKIVFFDEFEAISPDYSVRALKKIAIKKDIPIVRTDVIWRNTDSADSPIALSDLYINKYQCCCSMSDTVIAFNDFEYLKIFCDEHGLNLQGLLGVNILKQKGIAKNKEYRLMKKSLYYRTRYADSEID